MLTRLDAFLGAHETNVDLTAESFTRWCRTLGDLIVGGHQKERKSGHFARFPEISIIVARVSA